MRRILQILVLAVALLCSSRAFVPRARFSLIQTTARAPRPSVDAFEDGPLLRQRQSVARVQMKGIFGLGFGEIAIIAVAIGFLLGPEKIGEMMKSSAESASDVIKEVPKEFQKGLEEGEIEARSRNAKKIKRVPKDAQDAEIEKD